MRAVNETEEVVAEEGRELTGEDAAGEAVALESW